MKCLFYFLLLSLYASLSFGEDLESWREGENKKAIIDFVERVTNESNPDYVEPAQRIATFDNDGTLWSEVPTVELEFTKSRLKEVLKKDPALLKKEPYKSLAKNSETPPQLSPQEIIEVFTKTHAGMNEIEFSEEVKSFFKNAKHPKYNVPFTKSVYQPMLELLTYLKENEFEVFICSGGDASFIRVIATDVYGIPSQNIIGTNLVNKTKEVDGRLQVQRTERIELLNDKAGKPVGINRQIGKIPILAVGNVKNGGDIDHLRYSHEGVLPSLQLMINHDDALRESLYSEKDNASLAAAKKYNWNVISIKDDWKKVFPNFEE